MPEGTEGTEENDEVEIPLAWRHTAQLHADFKNYLAGGFTEDQALKLIVLFVMEQISRNAPKR